ncbi:MAG: alpha/beta hydrolase family protein [Anaerocolumna aminovalerica]|uniref:alpha/beta hydrolase n=1 Tax=Anaerocolumna aminovalerica TaxID=1527 RepID=UPI002914AD01|nr:alpha/beta hydrolase family protein [Anaerocolumna aminovalerica]MDU6263183.1 alpha/beta hydrolase family protein [Anaerocolumna aminovalerica]
MALLQVDFYSNVIGMCMQMDVILPQKVDKYMDTNVKSGNDKYPTLYLLHGMGGNNTSWIRRSSIERYVDNMGIAVVMPTTHLGWYTDMYHGHKYWTFISQELPAICHEFFPGMSEKREDNFVAGLSMGGYGAFKLALGCSDRFFGAASLSGALDSSDLANIDTSNKDFFENVFGPLDKVIGSDNDLFTLATKLKESGKPLPKLYMWCGTEDFIYNGNRAMKEHLENLGFDLTYEESAGDHQWKYWDEKIQDVLKWLPLKSNIN